MLLISVSFLFQILVEIQILYPLLSLSSNWTAGLFSGIWSRSVTVYAFFFLFLFILDALALEISISVIPFVVLFYSIIVFLLLLESTSSDVLGCKGGKIDEKALVKTDWL